MEKQEKKIKEINSAIKNLTEKIKEELKDAKEKAGGFVKKNPQKTALISAGIGATLGAFLSNVFTKKYKKSKKGKK